MGDNLSLGHQLTLQLMPVLMFIGAIMSLGASFWLPPIFLISATVLLILYWIYSMRGLRFEWKDLRFLILPTIVLSAGFLTYYHLTPAFYDQAYHLQISNRILDRWDWEPTHQGMSYSFRPEIVPGIAAVELWFTGNTSSVIVVPTLILISAAWSIQHLGEHYSNRMYGFIAGAVFCMFPIVIIYGRTMLLDIAVAGMIVSVFHHLELIDRSERYKLVLIGVLSAIIGLTKYPYLYLGGWIIVLFLLRKKIEESKFIALGYAIIITLFLLKNQIHTGWILGPLQSQITGTMASVDAISANTISYTPQRFISEYIEQWSIVLLCIALYGTALIVKREKEYILNYWVLILPAIFLHGYILDFGWPRYSTPWLALLCVGIPAAIMYSKDEFGDRLRRWKVPSAVISILILSSISPVLLAIEDIESYSEYQYKTKKGWSEIYIELGSDLNEQSTVITGKDITLGLYSETPSFRYEDPKYPMLQAINKFDATHIFTQDKHYRYDIDANKTFLFGSPIEPIKVYSSDYYTGRLWQVDPVRLDQSDWWRNSTIEINGSGAHYGDFVWLEVGSNFNLLNNTAMYRIYETDSALILGDVFGVLSNNTQTLLCDSVESCSSFLRNDHLDQNWAVWMTKTNSQ